MNRGAGTRGGRDSSTAVQPSACEQRSKSHEVYCGNLPDDVTEAELRGLLGQGSQVVKVKILSNKDGGKKFAIVRLQSAEAQNACVVRSGATLQGRRIIIDVAGKKPDRPSAGQPQRGRGAGALSYRDGEGGRSSVSYGLVPCVRGSDSWFLIFQQSISAANGTLKIDPFRGHQEPGESSAATAVRETHEESCHLFLLNATLVSAGVMDESQTVFFVPVVLEGVGEADLTQDNGLLVQSWKDNARILASTPLHAHTVGEVRGLGVVQLADAGDVKTLHIAQCRLALQAKGLCANFQRVKQQVAAVPSSRLVLAAGEIAGTVTFSAGV